MGVCFGHALLFDQVALCAVDQPQLGDLVQQLGVLGAQHGQPLVVAGCDLHGLPELHAGERLAQHQHAEILQFVGDLLGGAGLCQQDDACVGFLDGIGAQLVPELVGQGCVDDDDFKVACVHAAARFAAAGDNNGAGVAQLRNMPRQIFIGIIPGRNDQCLGHGLPSLPDGFFVPAVCGRIWNAPLRVVVGGGVLDAPRAGTARPYIEAFTVL